MNKKLKIGIAALAAIICVYFAVIWLVPIGWNVIDAQSVEGAHLVRDIEEALANKLISMVNDYGKTRYPVGTDSNVNDYDTLVTFNCADGSYYVLHYWYSSGYSFSPAHPGEDAYYSILTRYDAEGNAKCAWKMEYDFDNAFREWCDSI